MPKSPCEWAIFLSHYAQWGKSVKMYGKPVRLDMNGIMRTVTAV